MPTARAIITSALTFRLNRLSPGEALDADVAATCLAGLNDLVDEVDGAKAGLFREIVSPGVVTGVTGTLGVTWPSLAPGDQILGATYYDGSQDIPLSPLTIEQYESISLKTTGGQPWYFAHDGAETVYFYPAPTTQTVKLRTKQAIGEFVDLDTVYVMPKGYQSAFAALLAELLAPVMGGLNPAIVRAASMARARMTAQNLNPSIINGNRPHGSILSGWNA